MHISIDLSKILNFQVFYAIYFNFLLFYANIPVRIHFHGNFIIHFHEFISNMQ